MDKNLSHDRNRTIYYKIGDIERWLDFLKSTSYDNTLFQVLPSTDIHKSKWHEALTYYNYNEILELLDKGIVPLDRELLSERVLTDIFDSMVPTNCSHLLLDTDYGMIIFPKGIRPQNMYLDIEEFQRYAINNFGIKETPSNIFSIGPLRGSVIYESEQLHFTPIEIDVYTRDDVENVVFKIMDKIKKSKSRFQVWFRGQTEEFYLPKISPCLYNYCPWRHLTDISLIPSLYREAKKVNENIIQYAQQLKEIQKYEIGLKTHLKMPLYNKIKDPSIDFTEYFKDSIWEDSNTPFYWTHSDQNGNFIERHDYNPVFKGLQTSLFLQHYGIPTNILDITSEVDIALFFAQNRFNNGIYKPTDSSNGAVIYIFLFDPVTDRFVNSVDLLQTFNVQRPIRQKCGVITGASYATQNYYSRFISLKLKLKKYIEYNPLYTSDYISPQENEDTVLKFLNEYSREFRLKRVKPL